MSTPPHTSLPQERRIPGHLRCEIISTPATLHALLPQWSDLLGRGVSHTIFQTTNWVRALLASGIVQQVRAPVVYDESRLIGVWPLVLDGTRLRMLGHPYADHTDILCLEDDAPRVLARCLLKVWAIGGWKECEFDQVPAASRLARHMATLAADPVHNVQPVYRTTSPVVIAPTLGPRPWARSLKKRRQRLQKAGTLVFRHLESREEAREKLPTLFRQHAARMEARKESSRLLEDQAQRLFLSCIEHMDPARDLRFSLLELDGQAIASHFGFEAAGTFHYYAVGFDPAFAAYSPGEVLLGSLLEYAAMRGLAGFDLGIGAEAYKLRYADHFRENLTFYMARSGPSIPVRVQRGVLGRLRRYVEDAERNAFEQRKEPGPALRLLQAGMRARARFLNSSQGRAA